MARKRWETCTTYRDDGYSREDLPEEEPDTWELKAVIWAEGAIVFYWQREITITNKAVPRGTWSR